VELERFFEDLRRTTDRLLMLDYDGTLAPFQQERDAARPYPEVRAALSRLQARGHTRLVLVSGRPAEDVLGLLGLEPWPEAWGSHGAERRHPDGTLALMTLDAAQRAALARARRAAERLGLGRQLEVKPVSLALHWRGVHPGRAALWSRDVSEAWRKAAGDGLSVHVFDGGLELRPRAADKGLVVERMLAELPPGGAAAYLGDDTTDEDAFTALARARTRRPEDALLSVLVRAETRPSAADLRLAPPGELLDFLARWEAA
jgi:trehalose-phosphatase